MFENHIRITREQTDETIKKLREQLDDERKHINELKRTLPKNHEIENRGQSSTQESLDKLQRLKKELEDKEDE
jgi:predicted RNase H-like nuclease (RuvC/YqgF family)